MCIRDSFFDVLGRQWTLGTIQIDMALPGRFGLEYIGRDGEKHQPAMLHRAVLGSIERFMAIYIEHTGGDFPFWLSPVQVAILPISAAQQGRAREIQAELVGAGIRAEVDERSETLGFKIRETEINKIPLSLVIGEKEVQAGSITPRLRKSKKETFEEMSLDALIEQLVESTKARRMGPLS